MLLNPTSSFNNSSGASPILTPPPTTLGQRETADKDSVDCSCGLKVGCGMVVKVLDDNLCDILMVSISFASVQSRHCHLCSLEVNSIIVEKRYRFYLDESAIRIIVRHFTFLKNAIICRFHG